MPIAFTSIILDYLENSSVHFPPTRVIPRRTSFHFVTAQGDHYSKDDSVVTTAELVF